MYTLVLVAIVFITPSCPWTVACQAPLSMGFSRQEYWNGLPFLAPGDLPNPGIEPASVASPALQAILYHWATRDIDTHCSTTHL